MKLTQYTDYALRVLIYLALQPERLVTIKEIAEAYDVSRNHLMKVVNQLAHLGYIDAVRGQGGGLRLSRPASEINLGALIRDTEEEFNLAECFMPNNRCVITPGCQLKQVLHEALGGFFDVVDGYHLSDLLTNRTMTKKLHRLLLPSLPSPGKRPESSAGNT